MSKSVRPTTLKVKKARKPMQQSTFFMLQRKLVLVVPNIMNGLMPLTPIEVSNTSWSIMVYGVCFVPPKDMLYHR